MRASSLHRGASGHLQFAPAWLRYASNCPQAGGRPQQTHRERLQIVGVGRGYDQRYSTSNWNDSDESPRTERRDYESRSWNDEGRSSGRGSRSNSRGRGKGYSGQGREDRGNFSQRGRQTPRNNQQPWKSKSDGPPRPKLIDSFNGEVVYGVSPVLAALRSSRRQISTLYIQGARLTGHYPTGSSPRGTTQQGLASWALQPGLASKGTMRGGLYKWALPNLRLAS
ncbi:hypothetical protein CYMTET_21082, partial [Cymbomonas tetramitiformis]